LFALILNPACCCVGQHSATLLLSCGAEKQAGEPSCVSQESQTTCFKVNTKKRTILQADEQADAYELQRMNIDSPTSIAGSPSPAAAAPTSAAYEEAGHTVEGMTLAAPVSVALRLAPHHDQQLRSLLLSHTRRQRTSNCSSSSSSKQPNKRTKAVIDDLFLAEIHESILRGHSAFQQLSLEEQEGVLLQRKRAQNRKAKRKQRLQRSKEREQHLLVQSPS
jgi:hypothetical protein